MRYCGGAIDSEDTTERRWWFAVLRGFRDVERQVAIKFYRNDWCVPQRRRYAATLVYTIVGTSEFVFHIASHQ